MRRGDGAGRGGRSSAGASLTHVGQSSVEIGLMNRREAETAGFPVFSIFARHCHFDQHSSAHHLERERRGGQEVVNVRRPVKGVFRQ